MANRYFFSLALAGLAMMGGDAHAAAPKCTVGPYMGVPNAFDASCILLQTVKPVTRAYPGVNLDILGMRTGMTVSQVEAIAAKHDLGKPFIQQATIDETVNLDHASVSAGNKDYIGRLIYHTGPDNSDSINPVVKVYFSSPVTGHRSYALYQGNVFPLNPKKDPLKVKAVIARLLHQYGPPSHRYSDAEGIQYLCWNFKGKSLIKTSAQPPNCYPRAMDTNQNVHVVQDIASNEFQYGPPKADFYIGAYVSKNPNDPTKVFELYEWLGDYQVPRLDHDAAMTQLNRVAVKLNQKAHAQAKAKH